MTTKLEYLDCCGQYEIRGNDNHPFAKDMSKVYGVYTRQTELYHGVSPIWRLEGTDIYLYKKNTGGSSKKDRMGNMGRSTWTIGEILDGKQQSAFAYCRTYKAAFDWCPHRAHVCWPNHKHYDVEDMETDDMKKGIPFFLE